MKECCIVDSPLGLLRLTARDGALVQLENLGEQGQASAPASPLLQAAANQLRQYFAGQRQSFDLPLQPSGTPFQQAVWQQLRGIPCGQTRTYGQVAAALGRPGSARAVGSAAHRNPLPLLIPCHRLVGAGDRLTGFAWGLDCKAYLLELEKTAYRR